MGANGGGGEGSGDAMYGCGGGGGWGRGSLGIGAIGGGGSVGGEAGGTGGGFGGAMTNTEDVPLEQPVSAIVIAVLTIASEIPLHPVAFIEEAICCDIVSLLVGKVKVSVVLAPNGAETTSRINTNRHCILLPTNSAMSKGFQDTRVS